MAVGILIITHQDIGDALLSTASRLFTPLPLKVSTLSVRFDCDTENMQEKAKELHQKLDEGDGVIVFTDIFGSTPSNVAAAVLDKDRTHMIAGVSLPMLVRVLNYADLGLEELVLKAMSGAHDGIVHCTTSEDCEC